MSEELNSANILRELNKKEIECHEKKFVKFKKDIEQVVNKNSMENYCNIPDFLIAEYLVHCFSGLCGIKTKNDNWHKLDG